jgi:hypothetical protein
MTLYGMGLAILPEANSEKETNDALVLKITSGRFGVVHLRPVFLLRRLRTVGDGLPRVSYTAASPRRLRTPLSP